MLRYRKLVSSIQSTGRWTHALAWSLFVSLTVGVVLGATGTGPGLGTPEIPATTVSGGRGVWSRRNSGCPEQVIFLFWGRRRESKRSEIQ